ncbi:MAG: cofactor-independent phosphoglycerate mutase [Candidatus Zapsychrus exili]|nr:cofactor-independent phosphoglycerate mutase [Candidatus Zapsychrus exili]
MKYIIIVPDGMADHPVEEIGGRTPLEVANTPNMDYLAQRGCTGLVQTIPKGMRPGSDVANMSLLGYDPKTCSFGRASLEAANLGVNIEDDEVAFRCNLVTVENNNMIDYSSGHISTKEASLLIDALNEEMGFPEIKLYTGKSYRHLLVLKTNNAKEFLKIDATPPHDILSKDIKPYLPKGNNADVLLKYMEKSVEILKKHSVNKVRIDLKENPANMIWLWGQGGKLNIPSFEDKFGVKGSIISAVDLVNGLGKITDLDVVTVPGITGYYDTNYLGKAEYGLESLKSRDFVYIHIEAPDEAGHNGDLNAKIRSIEQIDKHIVGTAINNFGEHDDVRILVVPDHATPLNLRTHTSEPVGFVMYGKGLPLDNSSSFSEKIASSQELRFESGCELTKYFIKKYT